jgi:hypothetical protein
MSFEYSDVPCAEEQGTASEQYDEETGLLSAEVTLRCAYADRHALAADVCGNRKPWPKGGFGLTPRATRAAIRMDMSAGGVEGQILLSADALVTVYYSTKNEDIITESLEPTNEFVGLDFRLFRWAAGNGDHLTEEEAPGRLIRYVNFVRTELYVQPPLNPALLSLMGTCNDAPITSTMLFGLSFARETLLFAPPTINRKISALGAQQYDVVKKWSYNPVGWNKYFRQKTGQYAKIYVAGTNTPYESYTPMDHTALMT